jgi:hypothetical protein
LLYFVLKQGLPIQGLELVLLLPQPPKFGIKGAYYHAKLHFVLVMFNMFDFFQEDMSAKNSNRSMRKREMTVKKTSLKRNIAVQCEKFML